MIEGTNRLDREEIMESSQNKLLCDNAVLKNLDDSDPELPPLSAEQKQVIKVLWYYLQRHENGPYVIRFSKNTNSLDVFTKSTDTKLGTMEYKKYPNNDIEIAGSHPFGNPFIGNPSEHKKQGHGIPIYVATLLEIQKNESAIKCFKSHPMASEDDINIWKRFEEIGCSKKKTKEAGRYSEYFEFSDLSFLSQKRISELHKQLKKRSVRNPSQIKDLLLS